MEETKLLLKELESFKAEQERVRALVGRIGGRTSLQQDMIINILFLLISLKIIWMIHKQTKIDHFQFWILTSIEYQLTEVAKKVKDLEARIDGRTAGGK
jgi:hypothetical protein